MPAYPATPLPSVGSTVTPRRAVTLTDSEDGAVRGVSLWTKESYDVQIQHRNCTQAEKASLESYYATNKVAQVDITWDGSVYYCRYVAKPQSVPQGGGLWSVTARLIGTRSDGG